MPRTITFCFLHSEQSTPLHGIQPTNRMQVLVPSVTQSHSLPSFRPPQCVAFGQLHSPATAALHHETPQLASSQWHCSARSRHCQKRQTPAAAYGRGRDEQKPKDVKSIRRIPIFPLQQVAMPSVIIPLNIFEARCGNVERVRSQTHRLLMHASHAEGNAFCACSGTGCSSTPCWLAQKGAHYTRIFSCADSCLSHYSEDSSFHRTVILFNHDILDIQSPAKCMYIEDVASQPSSA